jgi:hypothetical protein
MPSPGTSGGISTSAPKQHLSIGMFVVRYGIGIVMVIAGIVMLVVSPSGLGVDGFAMAVGGGLAVLMINFLFRLGVSGDLERRREEEARRHFDEHGEWPAELERRGGRTWTLAPGVVTPEDEERERASRARR